MWWAIFADVGVMILAVLNAVRTLFIKGRSLRIILYASMTPNTKRDAKPKSMFQVIGSTSCQNMYVQIFRQILKNTVSMLKKNIIIAFCTYKYTITYF